MKIRKRHFVGLGAVSLAALSVAIIWYRTPVVPEHVSSLLTNNILREHGYRLSLDAVRGVLGGDIVLVNPRIVSLTDSTHVVLRADALRARIRRPVALLRGRVVFSKLQLERPRVDLPFAVQSAASGSDAQPMRFPRVSIDGLEVVDGSVARTDSAGRTLLVENANGRLRVRSRPNELQVTFERASFDLAADSLRVTELAGRAIVRDDTLRAAHVRVATPGSSLRGDVEVRLQNRSGRFEGSLEPLDVAEACRLARQNPHRGELSGPVKVEWSKEAITLESTLAGSFDDVALRGLDLDTGITPRLIELRRATGEVGGARVEATGTFERRGPGMRGAVRLERADLRKLVPVPLQPPRLESAPDHELTGTCRFQRGVDDSLHLALQLEKSRVRNLQLDRADAQLVVRGEDLWVRTARVQGPLGRLEGRGVLRGGAIDASFEAAIPRVENVLRAAGRPPSLSGDARVQGRVTGKPAAPDVELEARFAAVTVGPAVIWSGTLAAWGRPFGPSTELDLEVHADSMHVRGHVLRVIGADMSWNGRVMQVTRSQASAGDTLLAGAGTVEPLKRDWTGAPRPSTYVGLETALVRLGNAEIRVEDPATIWFREGAARVDSLRLVTRGGQLLLDGTYDAATRALDGRADLLDLDLGFVRDLVRLRLDVTGNGSGWIEAHGTLDRTRIRSRLEITAGTLNGLPIDSLRVGLVSTDAGTDVSGLQLVTPHGSLQGAFHVGSMPSLARWIEGRGSRRPIEELERATIAGVFQLEGLELAKLYQARASHRAPPAWTARLTSFVSLHGTIGQPEVELRGHAEQLRSSSFEVDGARFDVVGRNDSLIVRSLEIASEAQTLHAEGIVPIRLHLLRGAQLLRDRPLAARASLPKSTFAIVERFIPTFEAPPSGIPRGEVEFNLEVTGTLSSPEATGSFQTYKASFQLANMEEIYRDVDAHGVFDGKKLTIDALRGVTGTGGVTLKAPATVEFDFSRLAVSSYQYKLQLREVPIYSVPDITAIVNCDELRINSRNIARRLVPQLEGTLDVLRAEIRQEFTSTETSEVSLETDFPEWTADLTLRADHGDVWIRNSVVDAELEGWMRLLRSPGTFETQGLLRVRRGTYSGLVQRFEITSGTLDFSSGKGFDPIIDIEARSGRPTERVYLRLTGTASHPNPPTFSSDRLDMSSDEIEQAFLGLSGERTEVGSVAVANYAEQVLRDLSFVSEFSIDPAERKKVGSQAPGGLTGYNVSGGRPIGDRLFLLYTQGFYSDLEQRVAVEADINEWLLMEAAYERRDVSEAGANQAQNAYNLNLKFRKEY